MFDAPGVKQRRKKMFEWTKTVIRKIEALDEKMAKFEQKICGTSVVSDVKETVVTKIRGNETVADVEETVEKKSPVKRLFRRVYNIIIAYLISILNRPMVKKMIQILGIAGCLFTGGINIMIIGSVINFLLVALPFLILGIIGMLRMMGIDTSHQDIRLTECFVFVICMLYGVLVPLSNLIAGQMLLLLASIALYTIPTAIAFYTKGYSIWS